MIQHLSGCNKAVELFRGMSWDRLVQSICPGMKTGQQEESLRPELSFCLPANLITRDSLPPEEKEEAITLISKKTSKDR